MFTNKATEAFTAKEKKQFQEMLGNYDEKLYTKSIKIADHLLENYPNHPETRAFRAMAMSGLGKMKDAVKEIKAVLMKNMMNQVCWHIMGIIHRKEKEYDQARRAYLFALKCDSNNEQTMRELIQLQIHLRDYVGFEETSRKLLMIKPAIMGNWTMLSVACFVNRNYQGCLQAVNTMLKFQSEAQAKSRLAAHEISEIVLIAVRAQEALGNHSEALDYMQTHSEKIVDEVARFDYLGRLHQILGNTEKSVQAFENLLQLNSANLNTYKKIIEAKGISLKQNDGKLSDVHQEMVKGILDEYVAGFPRVNSHLRIGLRYLDEGRFGFYLEKYMRPLLIKGVPSLMMDLREFYSVPTKVQIIEQFLIQSLTSMESQMTLKSDEEEEQDPTVLLWLYYFIAQHHMFQNQLGEALTFVNKAIDHTPTLIDLYTLKGKIYQKSGDRHRAAVLHEEARKLDMADRAINAISAMYTLKTGDVERGTNIMDIFVKDCGYDVSIHDNQTMWFEQMTGRAYYEIGQYRHALKQFKYVQLHAEHIVQDHFDYYQYMMRKFTLKSMQDLLTFADTTLKQNRTVIKTAISYLRLAHRVKKCHDQEKAAFDPQMEAYLQSDDYKKLMETLSKAEDEDEYKNDTDPQGFFMYKKLLDGELDLTNWVEQVARVNTDANLNAKAIPAFLEKGKILPAMKSAICLKEKHASDPKTAAALVKLFKKWLTMPEAEKLEACGKDQRILNVVGHEIADLGCPSTEGDLVIWFDANRATGGKHTLEECHEAIKLRLRYLGQPASEEWGQAAVEALASNPKATLRIWNIIKTHKTLLKAGLNAQAAAFKAKGQELYPLATYWASAE